MDSKWLIDVIERAGYEPRSYSGRNMYGKQCVSLTTDDRFTSSIVGMIYECDDVNQAADLVRFAKQDSMGMGIVVYWPRAEWPEEL